LFFFFFFFFFFKEKKNTSLNIFKPLESPEIICALM